jgi:hypothetical protein
MRPRASKIKKSDNTLLKPNLTSSIVSPKNGVAALHMWLSHLQSPKSYHVTSSALRVALSATPPTILRAGQDGISDFQPYALAFRGNEIVAWRETETRPLVSTEDSLTRNYTFCLFSGLRIGRRNLPGTTR